MSMPVIPKKVQAASLVQPLPEDYDFQCRRIWIEVVHEVTDAKFLHRDHRTESCYKQGCTGPVCRKRIRDLNRTRRPEPSQPKKPRAERAFDPVIDYFYDVAVKRRDANMRARLTEGLI